MTLRDEWLLRIAAVSGGAALALTLFVAWYGTPIPGDLRIIREVQSWSAVERFEGLINPLGTFWAHLVIVVTGLAAVAVGPRFGIRGATVAERTIAAWALIAALGLRTISSPLKSMAQAERPSSAYDLRITHDLTSYGFPSGHVLGDVVVFGTLAVFAPWIVGRMAGAAMRVFCLAIILLAGPARMTVGAHWPSDVAGGYLWGGAALCVGLFFGRRMAAGR